jgi:hypothetical protein
MSDYDDRLPLIVMAVPPEGMLLSDDQGNPVRVHVQPFQGADIGEIKRLFREGYGIELSDENARILQGGGSIRVYREGEVSPEYFEIKH